VFDRKWLGGEIETGSDRTETGSGCKETGNGEAMKPELTEIKPEVKELNPEVTELKPLVARLKPELTYQKSEVDLKETVSDRGKHIRTRKSARRRLRRIRHPTQEKVFRKLEPILRLFNLQLQQRCSKLERFYFREFF
jgi:hypothetical protein